MENEQKSTMNAAIKALEGVMAIVPESERERLQKIIDGLKAADEADQIQGEVDEIDPQNGHRIQRHRL